ncbi:MAG: SoxR reducing system RseC family protein [Candidatus Eisenbacteria bacterium]
MEICGMGRVIRVDGEQAIVELRRQDACGHCDSADFCSSLSGRGALRVPVRNALGAREGQTVEIAAARLPGLSTAFVVYLLPTLLFLAGVLVGVKVFGWPAWGATLLGAGMLGLSWLLARSVDRSYRRSGKLDLSITRLLPMADPENGAKEKHRTVDHPVPEDSRGVDSGI